jgi:tellurite resistance protein TerC
MFRKLRFVLRRRYLWVPRPVKKAIVLVIGGTVLLLGIVMMIAPGPAFIVIPLGLAILAIEFVWARRWLKKIKSSLTKVKDRVMGSRKGEPACSDAV